MIIDAKNPNLATRGMLFNADTGERIPFAFWADTDTGEWKAWRRGPDGRPLVRREGNGFSADSVVSGRCRLRWVPAVNLPAPRRGGRPPENVPLAELARDARKGRPILAIPGRECEEPGCHRLAVWDTGDEQEVEPEVGPDGSKWERGVLVRKHRWCDWHYRPPVSTSLRGVENEVQVEARPS